MPTLVDLEGFEHGVDAANATATMNPALWDTSGNPAGISFVSGRVDGLAVQIAKDNTTTTRVGRVYTTPGTLFVHSFYLRVAAAPTLADARVYAMSADVVAFIMVQTTGTVLANITGGGSASVGPNVADGLWHLIDVRYNTAPNPHTIDWTVDGVTQTSASATGTASSNQDSWSAGGNVLAGDGTYQIDDIAISATTGDYPMGPHKVFSVVPAADGTHVAGVNIMENAGTGNDIGGAETAWDKLDDWPPTTGINNADSITSSATGATNYAEVIFRPKPDYAHQTLWGVSATVAHQSDTTGANTGISRIVDSAGTTLTDIFSGDMSEITEHYTRRIIAAPSGGWTVNNFAGIRGRVGFGTLQPGAPEWLALMVSAATPDETAVPNLVTPRRA